MSTCFIKTWVRSLTPSDVECVEFKGMTLLRLTYMLQRRPMFSSSQAKSSRTSFCLTPSRHHTQCHAMLILSHATPTLSSPLLRMFGEWDVMARYSAFDTPLGAAFVDPSFLEAARAPIEQGAWAAAPPTRCASSQPCRTPGTTT